jgi:glutamate/tyrosine decarboxylase-like PLP-dependent enzyme
MIREPEESTVKLPETGRDWASLDAAMTEICAGDIDWRRGRAPLYTFYAGESVDAVGKRAYAKFMSENALGGKRAFFGVKRMEEEVLAIGLDLFHAPAGARGVMTTGGTESIVLAVKGCRDRHRARGGTRAPNIVAPASAHPAFDKAGDLMDIPVRRVPLRPDLRADPDAMAAAIDDATMMLVGSAPCFPHGLVDPIRELGRVALDRGVWLHVDACVGGYVAPFVRMLGRPVPEFDLAVPGVRSLSADLHKFGFCPKPASTLFYAEAEDAERQMFDFDTWPNGRFATATLVGTRPAGSVAAAWAVLHHLGREGYLGIARRLMAMMDAYADGVEAIPGLCLWARPELTILNFGATDADIFAVAERMGARGWLTGLTKAPRGMHAMMALQHEPVREEYLADLAAAVEAVRRAPGRESTLRATY